MKSIKQLSRIIILTVFIINVPLFAQQVTKVLVSGLGGQHDLDVKSAFEMGYESYNGTTFSGSIDLYYDNGFDARNSFIYADANGYNVIVRSTTGLANVINQAVNYPGISVFMPAGSNSFVRVFSGNVEESPVLITGAGDTNNETGYDVEFFSIDPITIEPDLSSFSNGYIAGEISYLANEVNQSIDQVRPLARTTASNRGTYDQYDGYGQVDVETALGALPVELTAFEGNLVGNEIFLEWQTATEVNNFGFNVECTIDNLQWKTIGFVQGNGTTNSPKNYSFTDFNLPDANVVSYRLKQIDNDATFTYSKVISVDISTVTSVDDEIEYEFALEQNYPNPFNPSTTIKFALPKAGNVVLKVYNMLGEEVAALINNEMPAGGHEVNFDACKLSSGMYIYKLTSGTYSELKKLMLLK